MTKKAHEFQTIDYYRAGPNGLFVQVAGIDGETNKAFTGIVKFVQGRPFGDLVHPQKTNLSDHCRAELFSYLLNRYNEKQFE